MKKVKIFVDTTVKNPKQTTGEYAAIVEYITKNGPAVRGIVGKEENTTYNRCVLIGMVEALELLKEPCEVEIYTDCKFIVNMVNRGNPEAWRRSEWKKSRGGEVKHKELWQQYLTLADRHKIDVKHSENKAYKGKMHEMMGTVH